MNGSDMKSNLDISAFDIEAWLKANNVPYDTGGKNVQSGWLAVNCPFCDDHSNHLGINPETNGINCWRCPAKGTVISYVMKLKRIYAHEAISELKKRTHRQMRVDSRSFEFERLPKSEKHLRLPLYSQKHFENYHAKYLSGRGFDPEYLTKKFDLMFTGPFGDYRTRIIVPIYMRRQIVSFTTRDVTDQAHIPWVHGKPDHVIFSPKECLYNIDTVEDTALVVEGASDVWRIGDGTVATFGDKYTPEQVRLLRNVKRAFVLFDTEDEAQENASKLAYDLSVFVPEVHIYELDEGDPGNLSEDDVKEIRTEIFGRIF